MAEPKQAIPPRPKTRPEPHRSAVTLWRSGRALPWTVRVCEGTSAEELERLVQLAQQAAARLEGKRAP